MKIFAFHSFTQMKDDYILPILTTSLIHFPVKGVGRMYFLNLGLKGLSLSHYRHAVFVELCCTLFIPKLAVSFLILIYLCVSRIQCKCENVINNMLFIGLKQVTKGYSNFNQFPLHGDYILANFGDQCCWPRQTLSDAVPQKKKWFNPCT